MERFCLRAVIAGVAVFQHGAPALAGPGDRRRPGACIRAGGAEAPPGLKAAPQERPNSRGEAEASRGLKAALREHQNLSNRTRVRRRRGGLHYVITTNSYGAVHAPRATQPEFVAGSLACKYTVFAPLNAGFSSRFMVKITELPDVVITV